MVTITTSVHLCLLFSIVLLVIRNEISLVGLGQMNVVTPSAFRSSGLKFHNYSSQQRKNSSDEVILTTTLIVMFNVLMTPLMWPSPCLWHHLPLAICLCMMFSWDWDTIRPILQKREWNHSTLSCSEPLPLLCVSKKCKTCSELTLIHKWQASFLCACVWGGSRFVFLIMSCLG